MRSEAPELVPPFQDYLAPIVEVLRTSDAAVANDVLNRNVAQHMQLNHAVLSVLHDPEHSDQPEAFYRMAWARTYLKKAGYIDNPSRGAWRLTETGLRTSKVDTVEILRRVRAGDEYEPSDTEVAEHIADDVLALYRALLLRQSIPSGDALQACYQRFRERFGPEALRRLEGEELLRSMHGRRGNKNSLAYWLEFKDDEELPAVFGSIAGGSALKFGIYQSNETGEWLTGAPRAQQTQSVDQAIEFVRRQRDQLVAGGEYVISLARNSSALDYRELEREITRLAPDLAPSGWGHKYFSLLAPTILDDYHAVFYQDFHLTKLLKTPASKRYENARIFLAIARQLDMPVAHLTLVLNERHGNPHAYWRLDVKAGAAGTHEWPRMRDGGFVALGWGETGTLEELEPSSASKESVRNAVNAQVGGDQGTTARVANQLFQFVTGVASRDLVLAVDGSTVLGVGEISGSYEFKLGDAVCAHRRAVTWKAVEPWTLEGADDPKLRFSKLKGTSDLVAIERQICQPSQHHEPDPAPGHRSVRPISKLSGIQARVDDALRRKGQVILYGPPGTGKTFWAFRTVRELAARGWFETTADTLTPSQQNTLAKEAIEQCCFHPAYGYEDFIAGYRPAVEAGALSYSVTKGVFVKLCERASARPDRSFYLIIDEINRGDLPRILGELLTLIERDKRGIPVTVPLLSQPFAVPSNVFIIGTMNTADRSIALLDAALRRRFAFIELMPDTSTLDTAHVGSVPLGPWLRELNRRIVEFVGRDGRNLQVGQAYLFHAGEPIRNLERFAEVLRDDIIPLLQEYCYEDFGALERILGGKLVMREQRQVNNALFEPSRIGDLLDALLAAFPEITATRAATNLTEAEAPERDDETSPA